MESFDIFNSDGFIDMIVKDPKNPDRKQKMMLSLHDYLAKEGIAGQEFVPKPNSLKHNAKSSVKTNYNVHISWEGNHEDRGIKFPSESGENGKYCIMIYSDSPIEAD